MKIKPEQMDRLVDQLFKRLCSKDLVVFKAREADVRAKARQIIGQNFQEEDAIEEEARRMLASHANQVKDMDPYKMFVLMKQKIAEKRGFIL